VVIGYDASVWCERGDSSAEGLERRPGGINEQHRVSVQSSRRNATCQYSRRTALRNVGALVTALFMSEALCATPVALERMELEQTFWACDYVATTQGFDHTSIDQCTSAYEQIKSVMFEGDVDRLIAWWQLHKPAQHTKLQQLDR